MKSVSAVSILCLCMFLLPANRPLPTSVITFGLKEPEDLSKLSQLSIYATHYYVFQAKAGGTIPLLDAYEQPLGYYLDTCDWCLAAIEGTLSLPTDHGNVILNYAGRSEKPQLDCSLCEKLAAYGNKEIGKCLWTVSTGYGDGVAGYKLVPFRTIAVDQSLIAYGTVLYIPAAKGKEISLPDGTTAVHDGYFFAGDTGGDIKVNHIDVFTGTSSNPFPELVNSDRRKTSAAYVVTDPTIISELKTLHKKFRLD